MEKITSLHEIERITNSDPNILKEFITIFINETSLRIEEIEKYLEYDNWNELKKLAHKIKSSLLMVKMTTYVPIAQELEQEAGIDRQKTKTQVRVLITALTQAVAELENDLRRIA
jgi:HPt (histidine-containing phosphotransfer) domain-containing protein